MKIDQTTTTTTTSRRWKKNRCRLIFLLIYSYADQRDAPRGSGGAIVVDREKRKQKIRVQFHTRTGMVQGGMWPWICGDRER